MKFTVGEIIGFFEASIINDKGEKNLLKPLETLINSELPSKPGLKLSRFFKKILEEYKTITDSREKLFSKYGKLDDKTRSYNVPPENQNNLIKELNELFSEEIEIEFSPIKDDEMKDMKIDGNILFILQKLFEE